MGKVKTVLGVIWSSPITILCGIFYVLPFLALGWYKSEGIIKEAFVCTVNEEKSPKFVQNYWKRWAGHAMGNLIVMRKIDSNDPIWSAVFVHELCHVRQVMILGIFQPILYAMCLIAGKILQKCGEDIDGYYDNIFEVHARRTAGQVIDVVGYVKKLEVMKNVKK